MKINIYVIIALAIICIFSGHSFSEVYYGEAGAPAPDEVHLGAVSIDVPVNRFLLIRKDNNYYALKFTSCWIGSDGDDMRSTYIIGRVGISKDSIYYSNHELIDGVVSITWYPVVGRLVFTTGTREIVHGQLKLRWSGVCGIYFYEKGQDEGDHGMELAPTNWDNIQDIELSNQKLKWYKYDGKRKEVNISVSEFPP